MNKHTMGFAVVLGSLAAACASSAGSAGNTVETTTPSSETKYEIVIARPMAEGQRLRVELEAAESVDALTMDEANAEIDIDGVTTERKLSITGMIEIHEVDASGQVRRAELTVERFRDELGERDILKPGSKLLATRDGNDFAVVVDGELPGEDLTPWLALAFPQGRPGGMMVGETLTPQGPKAVGETWEINKSEVVSDLVDDGYETTETDVQGEVTLVGTQACGTGECLELSGTLQAQQATLTEGWDVTALEAGAVAGKARMLLPTDPEQPVFLEDGESAGTFVAGVKDEVNGSTSKARILVKRRRVATYTPAS